MIQELCILLGRFFQIRDDYLDAFADPSVLGKEGTDIQEGKCSWVVLKALSMCSEEDSISIKQHYGKANPEDISEVKTIFAKYDLKSHFVTYEKETKERIEEILASNEFPLRSLIPFFRMLSSKLFGIIVYSL